MSQVSELKLRLTAIFSLPGVTLSSQIRIYIPQNFDLFSIIRRKIIWINDCLNNLAYLGIIFQACGIELNPSFLSGKTF